jgi:hypothetical protein
MRFEVLVVETMRMGLGHHHHQMVVAAYSFQSRGTGIEVQGGALAPPWDLV